jgi:predicted DNA-binding transcriptional regulator AlpA
MRNRHPGRTQPPVNTMPMPVAAPRPAAPTGFVVGRVAYEVEDPLLAPAEAAAERRQALSTFYRDLKLKRVPPPLYVGPRAPRWRRSVIRAGIDGLAAKPGATEE